MYPLAGYEVGSLFAGRFQILSLLGVGGSGAVFRALDLRRDGLEVAVKLIAPVEGRVAVKPGGELLLNRAVDHPNIIKVLEGDISTDGIAFVVMEHLAGCTLRDCLDAAPSGMPLDEALAILIAIASALEAAHLQDVVHCDVKPSNILLGNNGEIKLADFGVARLLIDAEPQTHPRKELLGTPQYMAPEQLDGSMLCPQTDIFAFGAVAVELLTGRSAFDGADIVQLVARYRRRYPLTERDLHRGVPSWLRRLLVACCASNPNERPANGAVVSRALAACSFADTQHRWWQRLLGVTT